MTGSLFAHNQKLICGRGGIAGAAIATVLGQWAAMFIILAAVRRIYPQRGKWDTSTCFQIYQNGTGSIVTQSLYTLYIVGLNMILALFSEDAVTVLGIYYKIQSFFFIPLLGFQQVLLPVISYNFGAGQKQRIQETVRFAVMPSVRGALWGMSMGSILKLLAEKPRILYIAATDGRYGGVMAVGDGIRGVHAEQRFLDINTPLAKWSETVRELRPNIIIGYPSAVKILAEVTGREKEPLHIRRVISCGEPLSNGLRKFLENIPDQHTGKNH